MCVCTRMLVCVLVFIKRGTTVGFFPFFFLALPESGPGSPVTGLKWKCAAGQSGVVIISSLH